MLKPINDLGMFEIQRDKYNFKGTQDTAQNGILVALPDKFNFFGYWSFAFEDSFMAKEKLEELYHYYKSLIGQRCYWTSLAEKGNILEKGNKAYCYVKLTSLISVDDDTDNIATNVLDNNGGAFSA